MGKLVGISIAGLDNNTSPGDIEEISKAYPEVEFGILCSEHWYENGNRYLDPLRTESFKYRGIKLCAHLCGNLAKIAYQRNYYGEFMMLYGGLGWSRIQLNIAPYPDLQKISPVFIHPEFVQEVIIQCKSPADFTDEDSWITPLFDRSGGNGIYTKPEPYKYHKVGYSGGLRRENISAVIKALEENPEVDKFWVDLESGVRDKNNWLDPGKVWELLEEVYGKKDN